MLAYYFYLLKDKDGRHEVHTKDCSLLPIEKNRALIGMFDNCKDALNQARFSHPDKPFYGCRHCSDITKED